MRTRQATLVGPASLGKFQLPDPSPFATQCPCSSLAQTTHLSPHTSLRVGNIEVWRKHRSSLTPISSSHGFRADPTGKTNVTATRPAQGLLCVRRLPTAGIQGNGSGAVSRTLRQPQTAARAARGALRPLLVTRAVTPFVASEVTTEPCNSLLSSYPHRLHKLERIRYGPAPTSFRGLLRMLMNVRLYKFQASLLPSTMQKLPCRTHPSPLPLVKFHCPYCCQSKFYLHEARKSSSSPQHP